MVYKKMRKSDMKSDSLFQVKSFQMMSLWSRKVNLSITSIITFLVLLTCARFHLSFAAVNLTEPIDFNFLPAVHNKVYSKLGDINIGALSIVLSDHSSPGLWCDSTRRYITTTDYTESIAFAVDLVNRLPNILPNVTLGFIQRGICKDSPNVALATSLSFLPRSERVCNGSECFLQRNVSYDSQWMSHDVIGLVTPGRDKVTKMVSRLYSIARIPMIGPTEISDEFSDKNKHPYFFRIVPPSKYTVTVMLRFLSSYRLTYISVIYQEGYESSYKTLEQLSSFYGVCIAYSRFLTAKTDYKELVLHLLEYPRARALVMFVQPKQFRYLLRGVTYHGVRGHFIFVGGDILTEYSGYGWVGTPTDPGLGTFVFDLYYKYVNDFYYYLANQTIATTKNPWLWKVWEYLLMCKLHVEGDCDFERNILETSRFRANKEANLRIDAVLTLAHAAHNLLSERCPGARGQDARRCIEGDLLRQYLKRTTFTGFNDDIKFDQNQEKKGKFIIGQMVYAANNYPFIFDKTAREHMNIKNVAVYDTATDEISYLDEPITWDHLNTLERIVPWTNSSPFPIEVPESICSGPCAIGEYKIEKEVPCCWECRKCRDNERLLERNANCEACPSLLWPDPDSNFTLCIDIPPTYPKLDEPIPVALTSFGVVALVLTVLIIVLYVRHRDERVIKASSTELSAIQLVAIFLGYITVILFQTPPNNVICNVIYVLFCMSFALLYCPLLVKTIRIVRIFKSGIKNERPRFISPWSQIVFSICLISVQVGQCSVTYILFQPGAQRTQPIWSEKLVELSCDFTLSGIAFFLGYNILLVTLLCSVFAFMVRNLPDNFNESKFISMCVSTTLLIWLAFVPSYFTADREYIRIFLLSTALVFNHSVALALLFAPKIYVAMFMQSESGNKKS